MAGSEFRRYGHASSCYQVTAGDRELIFDAGLGIIPAGRELLKSPVPELSLYFTHFHIDHCLGLNYLLPLYRPEFTVSFIGPVFGKGTLKKNLEYITDELLNPVGLTMFPCRKNFIDLQGSEVLGYCGGKSRPYRRRQGFTARDQVVVRTLHNPAHSQLGVINYRVEFGGKTLVLATDVEGDTELGYSPAVADFAAGADLLLLDGQYTAAEYAPRRGWGHSTFEMACRTAEFAGVKQLVVIHHDPGHTDKQLAAMEREARAIFRNTVFAREGMALEL